MKRVEITDKYHAKLKELVDHGVFASVDDAVECLIILALEIKDHIFPEDFPELDFPLDPDKIVDILSTSKYHLIAKLLRRQRHGRKIGRKLGK